MQESSVKVMRSSSFLVAMVLLCSMKEGAYRLETLVSLCSGGAFQQTASPIQPIPSRAKFSPFNSLSLLFLTLTRYSAPRLPRCAVVAGWPELLPWLFDMSNSERNLDREAALTIFHEISPYLLGKGLEESLEGLKFVLGKSLEDSCTRVEF